LHPADLADILEALSSEERQSIIDSLDEQSAAETLAELDSRLRQQIVEKLDPERAADIIEEMAPDQAADLLAGLSPETSKGLLEEMPHHEASDVRALMKFDQNTAGGMMNTQFMLVGETATREEVIEWIRSNESDLEQLDAVFLTDLDAKFTGIVPTGRLLLATTGQTMNSLKSEPLLHLPPDANEKEVFELFDKYNLRVLGVVDESGVPIGAITVDDVVTRLAAKV
jgi:Mg/Co/Ni transporter MgtE